MTTCLALHRGSDRVSQLRQRGGCGYIIGGDTMNILRFRPRVAPDRAHQRVQQHTPGLSHYTDRYHLVIPIQARRLHVQVYAG